MLNFFYKLVESNNKLVQDYIELGAMLVDVRTLGEFSNGSIARAVNIPLGELDDHLTKLKDQTPIVVFCQSGIRSQQALKKMKAFGINGVINGGSLRKMKKRIKALEVKE